MVEPGSDQKSRKGTLLPEWSVPVIICVLALGVASLIYDRAFSSCDDGVAAEGARLVLHGKAPYRDFWTIYTPGSFYANAVSLAVLGEKLNSIRVAALLQGAIQAVLLCAILRRARCRNTAAIASGAVLLALIPLGTLTYWFTAILTATYALLRVLERPRSGWAYGCGFLIALTLLFRQDAGAYMSAAAFPLIYAATPDKGVRRLTPLIKALGTFVVVLAATVSYFAVKGALPAMVDQAARFACLEYPGSRPLPYPVPWHEVLVIGQYSAPVSIAFLYQLYGFYVMPVAVLVFSVLTVRRMMRNGCDQRQIAVAALCCLALVMFAMVRVRPSGARIVATAMLSTVAYLGLAMDSTRAVRVGAVVALAVSLVAFAPFGAYSIWAQRAYATSMIGGKGGVYAAPGHAECLTVVAAKVTELTSPPEKILAGAPVIYFLAGREPATRYYEPHPRMTDTPKIQQAIIRDMDRNHVRYFVRSSEWGAESYFTIEPQCQPRALIDYIERNYRVRYDYTILRIYERRTPFAG